MIRELSRSRLIWDALILALIVVSCVLVSYQFAFAQARALDGFQLIYLIDLFFLVDIGLNFVTTYRERGVEVFDKKHVHGVMADACSLSTLLPRFLLT